MTSYTDAAMETPWQNLSRSYLRYINNLQCCGNCINYRYGNLCDEKMVSHDSCCDNWSFDGLTRKDREVSN